MVSISRVEIARAAWEAMNTHMDALVAIFMMNAQILQVSTQPLLHYMGTPTCAPDDA